MISIEFILKHTTVTSSLELASKNIVCGSVKMVYALIYTLFLVRTMNCLFLFIRPLKILVIGLWASNWIRSLPTI
jgi:hypothetical protein